MPFTLALPLLAQGAAIDLKTLVGRKAIIQRMPFYVPGTYQAIPQTYAGQTVTIIAVKPSTMYAAMPKLSVRQMASLPPESRANIENVRNASTFVVQFEDGTKADTGAIPIMPTTFSSYLDLIPYPAAEAAATAASVVPTTTDPASATRASSPGEWNMPRSRYESNFHQRGIRTCLSRRVDKE